MSMIERKWFSKTLDELRGKHIIKVVSGVRRCGKSTLLINFKNKLLQEGIDPKRIISLNFEDSENEWLLDRKKLHKFIVEQIADNEQYFVFLDEVQAVRGFEKTVDSLFLRKNIDMYITGSNAYLLSGELATLLSGRYIEIPLLPYSFSEYMQLYPKENPQNQIYDFLEYGGFPQAAELACTTKNQAKAYLKAIYDSVVTKDILSRLQIRKEASFEAVVKFIFHNIGNATSVSGIVNNLKVHNKKIDFGSVDKYLNGLRDSFVVYKTDRYDIKGKAILKTQDKYYAVDTGLRQAVVGAAKGEGLGHLLENAIYLELLRRSSEVFIGKVGENEVDFVALGKDGETSYYQVALTVREQSTLERELKPLNSINDHCPKYLITLDPEEPTHNGIRQVNAVRWLLG
ncbi:ATPase [Fibrobacterales bacterium]|nr:ATPase [Fibrobacterales bacterium]